jgi:uncharacterized membrane protein YfcA
MIDVTQFSAIVAVAFGSTLISSMCGGGSNMISTPFWLMMGFPLPVAMATNTLSGAMWTLVAARNYLRGHEVDWRLIGSMAAAGLVGAYFGAQVVMHTDPKSMQRIIGVIILSLVAYTFFKKEFGIEKKEPTTSRLVTSLAGFPLGFYESFFGSGNSLITSAILTKTRGFKLLEALGYSYVMSFFWCLFASCMYGSGGNWKLSLIIPSVIGAVCGAYLGSHIGAKKGTKFVKSLFVAIGTVLGLKLLLGL